MLATVERFQPRSPLYKEVKNAPSFPLPESSRRTRRHRSHGHSTGRLFVGWIVVQRRQGEHHLPDAERPTTNLARARRCVAAFEKANPNITVKIDTQPAGTEGDNLMKTKLSTGDMDDVFYYNSGSLLQALHPDSTLVDLSNEAWVKDLSKDFKSVVSTDKGLYGAPYGTSFGGGVLYNKKVYDKLGLKVPTDWAEFISNSEKIKSDAPDVAPDHPVLR